MFGVTKMQSLNCIMGMKVECKAAHSSMLIKIQCLQRRVCQNEAFSVQQAFTLKKSNDRSPNMGIWIATVSLKNSGNYAGKSKWQSFWAHFLTCQHKLQKMKKNKDGSDCNQKGRRQWKSQAHSLHLFPVLSEIDTSNTSRMTFTKSVLQSIKSWECQSSSRSSLVAEVEKGAGAECESEAAWKAAQKIGQEGTLFPSQASVLKDQKTLKHCADGNRKDRNKTCKKHKDQLVLIVSCVSFNCWQLCVNYFFL